MGKQSGIKKKKNIGAISVDSIANENKCRVNSPKAYDKDTEVFILMSKDLKDEGNKLFQKRDYELAMSKYEKAIKLLPKNHIDVSYLRSNMATCFMEMGISEYPRAIHECNLALEVTPKYSKALLKRARCYEALNKLDLAYRDLNMVLKMDPNNIMASEVVERVRASMEQNGIHKGNDISIYMVPDIVEPTSSSSPVKKKKNKNNKLVEKRIEDELIEVLKEEKVEDEMTEKLKEKENIDLPKDNGIIEGVKGEENINLHKNLKDKKKKNSKKEKKVEIGLVEVLKGKENIELPKEIRGKVKIDDTYKLINGRDKFEEKIEDKKTEDKLVVGEIISNFEEQPKRNVKLVFGDDIRSVQLPFNCSILKLIEVIRDRFPNTQSILVYRDQEGDLVTITTNVELKWAETSNDQGSLRLYIFEASSKQDPFHEKFAQNSTSIENKYILYKGSPCIDDWIIQFAQLFKDYVGFNSDGY